MKKSSALFALFFLLGCNAGVASEEQARIAYLGIDTVIVTALELGFIGFNQADNANFPPQSADGEASGTITISGSIDQGVSDNKGMQLQVALVEFSNGPIDDPETEEKEELDIVYDSAEDAPLACSMKLRNIPDGTLEEGTMNGTVLMTGELEGELEVDLTFSGQLEPDPESAGGTRREAGTTQVTGTATSGAGTFEIDTKI